MLMSPEIVITPTNGSHRSFGLDLARAIAISLVLASHFGHNLFDSLGFWGVELFFALSGFLIGQILWRNFSQTSNWTGTHVMNFWRRRWWRTLPNYYLFFAVLLVLHYVDQGKIPAISELSRFLWFGQYLFKNDYGFYSQSWSLCIEEWFYLMFPVMLFLLNKIISKKETAFVFTLIIFFIIIALVRTNLMNHNDIQSLRRITFARLDAIACGVAIAYWELVVKPSIKIKLISYSFGIAILFISLYSFYMTKDNILKNNLILFTTPLSFALSLPIISLWKISKQRFKFIASVVENISLWSYSIYL
ncbi:MAG: acyltransferase, partial [Rickettsiales bacterium]